MTGLEDLKQKADQLMRRYNTASRKRSELKGQLGAVKTELVSLAEEIKAAGFDPKTLKAARDEAYKDLQDLIEAFDKELTEVEAAIKAFDVK